MVRLLARFAAALLLVLAPATGVAQPITYSFVGTMTGAISIGNFSNTPFEFRVQGDAGRAYGPGAPNVFRFDGLAAEFFLAGLDRGPFVQPVSVVLNRANQTISFVLPDLVDPVSDSLTLQANDGRLSTYDLRGPLSTLTPQTTILSDPFRALINVGLPRGLYVSSVSGVTFSAAPTAVPEPATVVLVGAGAVALGLVARRRAPN